MNNPVNIAIAADAVYLVHARVMLCSLFSNNKDLQFKVYLFTEVDSHQELTKLENLASQFEHTVVKVPVDASLFNAFFVSGHISIATYYRLLIPELLPSDVKKILYLDTDILVQGNIGKLWEEDLANFCIGAVDDNTPYHIDRLNLPKGSTYFNAGVLLIKVDRWKELEITKKGLSLAAQYGDKLIAYDQDVLNMLLVNDWKELPSKWNQMEGHRLGYLEQAPTIVHFVGPKPWSIHCIHPLKGEYYRYYYNMEGFPKKLADASKRWTRAFLRAISG